MSLEFSINNNNRIKISLKIILKKSKKASKLK